MNNKGFSLIELILTLAIIGVMSISIFSIFNTGLLNIVRAGNRTKAVNIAENELLVNPIILNKDEVKLKIPVPTEEGSSKEIIVTGSLVKGLVKVNQGLRTELNVEINAFVPGLYSTEK